MINFRNILLVFLILLNQNLYCQEENYIRIDIGLDVGRGLVFDQVDLGLGLTLNPSFTITDNQKVGINLSVFSLLKDLENKNYTERQLIKSVLGTYDYYFAQQNNFAFSIGGGLGIYNINHDLNSLIYYANSGNIINQNDNVFTGSKPGLMLRPGIEFGKFRLGIEFNLIPSYTYKASNSILDETSKNSFFKWNLGIFLGGGHHKSRFN